MPNVPNQEEWVQYLRGGNNPLANPIVELSQAPITVASARGGTATSPQGSAAQPSLGGTQPGTQQGETTTPTGGSVLSSGDTSLPSASQGAASGLAQPQQRPLDPGVLFPERQFLYGTQGGTAERLFAPGEEAQQRVSGFVDQAGKAFSQAAGPTGQTFQSRGGAGTLGKYVEKGEGLEGAKGLLATTYQGPDELSDVAETQKARESASQEMTRRSALRTGGGVMALLTSAIPGLTPGMAKYEAQNVFSDPTYRQKAAREEESAGGMLSRLAAEEQKAKEIAAKRANEELAIQNMAREWLQGRRGGVLGDIEGRVASENARRRKMEEAWAKYQETGDPSYLMNAGFDWDSVSSPYAQGVSEAQSMYEKIMKQFGDISMYPLLEKRITGQGNEYYGADWWGNAPPSRPAGDIVPPQGGSYTKQPWLPPDEVTRITTPANGAPTSRPTQERVSPSPAATTSPFDIFTTKATTQPSSSLASAVARTGATTPRSTTVLRGALNPASVLSSATSKIAQAAAKPGAPAPTDVSSLLQRTASPVAQTSAAATPGESVLQTAIRNAADSLRNPIPESAKNLPDAYAPDEGYEVDIGGQGPVDIRKSGLPKDLQTRLIARQREMEKSFGEEGTMRDFLSLYFNDEAGTSQKYEPGLFGTQYSSYNPGTEASTANMAEQSEVDILNRIAELLELQEVAAKSQIPYQAPTLTQDIAGYQNAEKQRMAERRGRLNEADAVWAAKVAKARSDYKKHQGDTLLNAALSPYTVALGTLARS